MKPLLIVIIFLHGIIHLIGFVKGFFPASLEKVSLTVSYSMSVVWLLTSVLFLASGISLAAAKSWWHIPALVAVVLSAVLIISIWQEARFGMILNLVVLVAALISIGNQNFDAKLNSELKIITPEIDLKSTEKLDKTAISQLPQTIQNWLKASGAFGKEKVQKIVLTQDFKMKLNPEQKNWYHANARQVFNVNLPAFVWTVDLKMNPLIHIRGRDKFFEGKGEMEMRMNGLIPLGKETGFRIDEGTLQRFLGEIVWFPSAATNDYIQWQAIDKQSATASMTYRDTKASGTFYFGDDGLFERYTAMRFKGNESDAKKYLWEIKVLENKSFNGVIVPSKCEAIWHLDEGLWKWSEIEIVTLEYDI